MTETNPYVIEKIYLTQLIFINPGKEQVFMEFEDFVLPLMEKYRGKMLYRIRPGKNNFVHAEGDHPYEIHFLSFESEEDFSAYMKDNTRLQWIHLKQESVQWTILVKGHLL